MGISTARFNHFANSLYSRHRTLYRSALTGWGSRRRRLPIGNAHAGPFRSHTTVSFIRFALLRYSKARPLQAETSSQRDAISANSALHSGQSWSVAESKSTTRQILCVIAFSTWFSPIFHAVRGKCRFLIRGSDRPGRTAACRQDFGLSSPYRNPHRDVRKAWQQAARNTRRVPCPAVPLRQSRGPPASSRLRGRCLRTERRWCGPIRESGKFDHTVHRKAATAAEQLCVCPSSRRYLAKWVLFEESLLALLWWCLWKVLYASRRPRLPRGFDLVKSTGGQALDPQQEARFRQQRTSPAFFHN